MGAVDPAADLVADEPGEVALIAAERLVFFTDAVVAIAITLLALELPVPEGDTSQELLASLGANSFAYLTFLISFLVIGAHWRAHHSVFRYLHGVDSAFVKLTLVWLLIIVATPFLTEVIREGGLDVVRFGLYALAQALLLIVFDTMQWVARRRGLFVAGTPSRIAGQSWWQSIASPGGFLVSIPLFPLIGAWAFVLWAVVPNVPQLASRLSERGRRSAGG